MKCIWTGKCIWINCEMNMDRLVREGSYNQTGVTIWRTGKSQRRKGV